jgi:hypothetical protein
VAGPSRGLTPNGLLHLTQTFPGATAIFQASSGNCLVKLLNLI